MSDGVYQCPTTDCRLHAIEYTKAEAAELNQTCPLCHTALGTDTQPVVSVPSHLHPSQLPTFLAYPWNEYLAENIHPRLKLLWLVDTAEVAVRWCVAVALAEVVAANDGVLEESLATSLRKLIPRPTLGAWLAILELLSRDAHRPETPRIAPEIFALYLSTLTPLFRSGQSGGDDRNSLLELRNTLVHGGGVSSAVAQDLLACHRETIETLLTTILAAVPDAEVLCRTQGRSFRLQGPVPQEISSEPVIALPEEKGPCLVSGDQVLPLSPLLEYGLTQQAGAGEQNKIATPQVYYQATPERMKLSYIPLQDQILSCEWLDPRTAAFFELFGFNADKANNRPERATVQDDWKVFLQEARHTLDLQPLIGREKELAIVKGWLKGRDTRQDDVATIGWIHGAPGIGKSLLMAQVARDAANDTQRQHTFFYSFRGGDARNNRQAFLRTLRQCLLDWTPLVETTPPKVDLETDKDLLDDIKTRLKVIQDLPAINPKVQVPVLPRFIAILDGLDEIISHDRTFSFLIKELALPGTIWLVAGRNEHGLSQSFSGPNCDILFPEDHGLPGLEEEHIRALLSEQPAIRLALAKLDEEENDKISNAFIDRVTRHAAGLPLYVHLVLNDLEAGKLSVHDWSDLPESLTAYYDKLIQRLGIDPILGILSQIICLLGAAEEPLDNEALATLLADEPEAIKEYRQKINKAILAGGSLLKRAITADQTDGWTLYHQSFREHVAGRRNDDGIEELAPSPTMLEGLMPQRRALCRLATQWDNLPEGNLRNHLFRWGNSYALWWREEKGTQETHARLTDFDYLMERCKVLPSTDVTQLVKEYKQAQKRLPDSETRQAFRYWEAFFRERAHILRRGKEDWPTYKILLQLAIEHADNSPLTIAAEKFLAEDKCDWAWLRRELRPKEVQIDPCIAVFEGHVGQVDGAEVLPGGRILSWSCRHRGFGEDPLLWNADGQLVGALEGRRRFLAGVKIIANGNILTWDVDGELRLWKDDGRLLNVMNGHNGRVTKVNILSDFQILSWSDDCSVRLWSDKGEALAVFPHRDYVVDADLLPDGRIFTCSEDILFIWTVEGKILAKLKRPRKFIDYISNSYDGHFIPMSQKRIDGAKLLSNGNFLSWYGDFSMQLWDADLKPIVQLKGHRGFIPQNAVKNLSGGRFVSKSFDRTLRVWGSDGQCLTVLEGHEFLEDTGFLIFDSDFWGQSRVISVHTHKNGNLSLWDVDGGVCLITLNIDSEIVGAQLLPDGRILTWTADFKICIWNADGAIQTTCIGHLGAVFGSTYFPDGYILSWSADYTIRIWDETGECLCLLSGHTGPIHGAVLLSDGSVMSWSKDKTLRRWDISIPTENRIKKNPVSRDGSLIFSDGRILTWNFNTLRILNAEGQILLTLEGHDDFIIGAKILPSGVVLSWAADNTLRMWDEYGESFCVLEGHKSYIVGAEYFNDHILSWEGGIDYKTYPVIVGSIDPSGDRKGSYSLRLWSLDGVLISEMHGHLSPIVNAKMFADGSILTWDTSEKLGVWKDGQLKAFFQGRSFSGNVSVLPERRNVSGTIFFPSLSFYYDERNSFYLGENTIAGDISELFPDDRIIVDSLPEKSFWSTDGKILSSFCSTSQLQILPNGSLLSWTRDICDEKVCLWDKNGQLIANLAGMYIPLYSLILPKGNILVRAMDGIYLWETDGQLIAKVEHREGLIKGVMRLQGERNFSWSKDGTLRIWSDDGQPLAVWQGHQSSVDGVKLFPECSRIISWSEDGTLRIWSDDGQPLAVLEGHQSSVDGVKLFPESSRIISWTKDGTLRIWSDDGQPLAVLQGSETEIEGVELLYNGYILTWGNNYVNLWSPDGDHLGSKDNFMYRFNASVNKGVHSYSKCDRALFWASGRLFFEVSSAYFYNSISEPFSSWKSLLCIDPELKCFGVGSCMNVVSVGVFYEKEVSTIEWHGAVLSTFQGLSPRGVLVVSQGNGDYFCIECYLGAQQVDIENMANFGSLS